MVYIIKQMCFKKYPAAIIFAICLLLLCPVFSSGYSKEPAIEFDNIKNEILNKKDYTPEDLLKMRTETGKTFLMLAAMEGLIDWVQIALDFGIRVNERDNYGNTALMLAAYSGHLDVAKLLIENKADVNMMNNDGWTALMCAARQGHIEIVNLLIDKDADIYIKSNAGWTALVFGATKGHDKIVELLETASKSDIDYTALGHFYKKKGGYDKALKNIHKALNINPQNYEAISVKAELLLRQGDIEKSKEFYKKALELTAGDLGKEGVWEKYSCLTWYALLIPDFPALEKYVKEGLSFGGGYAHSYLHSNLGVAYLLQDKKSEGIAELKSAIQQDLKDKGKDSELIKDLKDSFPILKLRYPEKSSLIEWAERELGTEQ